MANITNALNSAASRPSLGDRVASLQGQNITNRLNEYQLGATQRQEQRMNRLREVYGPAMGGNQAAQQEVASIDPAMYNTMLEKLRTKSAEELTVADNQAATLYTQLQQAQGNPAILQQMGVSPDQIPQIKQGLMAYESARKRFDEEMKLSSVNVDDRGNTFAVQGANSPNPTGVQLDAPQQYMNPQKYANRATDPGLRTIFERLEGKRQMAEQGGPPLTPQEASYLEYLAYGNPASGPTFVGQDGQWTDTVRPRGSTNFVPAQVSQGPGQGPMSSPGQGPMASPGQGPMSTQGRGPILAEQQKYQTGVEDKNNDDYRADMKVVNEIRGTQQQLDALLAERDQAASTGKNVALIDIGIQRLMNQAINTDTRAVVELASLRNFGNAYTRLKAGLFSRPLEGQYGESQIQAIKNLATTLRQANTDTASALDAYYGSRATRQGGSPQNVVRQQPGNVEDWIQRAVDANGTSREQAISFGKSKGKVPADYR